MITCEECHDTGTRKIVDDLGSKIWVDCDYCDNARLRRAANIEQATAEHEMALQQACVDARHELLAEIDRGIRAHVAESWHLVADWIAENFKAEASSTNWRNQ